MKLFFHAHNVLKELESHDLIENDYPVASS